MDDRTGFERAIKEDRYDSFSRQVYADWLEERGFDDEAMEQRRLAAPEWVEADKWLRRYAKVMNPYDVEEYDFDEGDTKLVEGGEDLAFARLIEGLRTRELLAHGTDLHGLYELDDADELRQHAQVWLNRSIEWSGFEFFCSC